jgi:hypothetical protein
MIRSRWQMHCSSHKTRDHLLKIFPLFMHQVFLWNDSGREIQSQSINYTGGLDIQTTQFDFSGKELISGLHHQFLTAPAQTYESATLLTYDALQRPTMTQKMVIASVVSTPSWKTISTTAYNAIGQATTHTIQEQELEPLQLCL